MINFQTKNLIIVRYPINAGGKFLINCLGLSDDAVFQDATLARQQLNGNFNQTNKFQYIKDKISDRDIIGWRDLDLGCEELFGTNKNIYFQPTKNNDYFNDIIDDLSNNKKKFFIVAHNEVTLKKILDKWPNSKIIYFFNCNNFINYRVGGSNTIKDQLKEQYILWNTDNYFSEDTTVNEIKKLYNILDLSTFNERLIREYYNLWINKITK